MGSSSPALSNMQFLVLLSAVALAFASPIPDGDEAPAALPYVHDATGDVAVDDSPAALPYVHDATGDVADDASPLLSPTFMTPPATLPLPTFTRSPSLPPWPSPPLPSLMPPTPTPTVPIPTWLLALLSPRLR